MSEAVTLHLGEQISMSGNWEALGSIEGTNPSRLDHRKGQTRTREVRFGKVGPLNTDPSRLIGLALIRANEDAGALASFYQKEASTAYGLYRRTGRFTPPARSIPRFRKYTIDDFHFIKVLGKGSFGKVNMSYRAHYRIPSRPSMTSYRSLSAP
ncbi:Putative protein kinase C delta type homolog [Eumeta japonica]|uniref:Uncharacterized protein n=1 Tax=Eumeta variegata TaxID=151549 RepID=A0A4C1USN1_EUMVA|nr:Putative protein kinase C delta type homolog [Eumeta japonica]